MISELSKLQPLTVDLGVVQRTWSLAQRHALSSWDTLTAAAALAGDFHVLLTEDLQHGQVFGNSISVRVLSPFAEPLREPNEILQAIDG